MTRIRSGLQAIRIGSLIFAALVSTPSAMSELLVGPNKANGDFNTTTGSAAGSFSQLSNWSNIGVGGNQNLIATRDDSQNFNGTNHAVVSHLDSRVFGLDTDHTLVLGQTFDISYVCRNAGAQWELGDDQMSVSLFTTDDDTIGGVRQDLVTGVSGLLTADRIYQLVNHNDIYTVSAADVGKKLFVAMQTVNGTSGDTSNDFALVDNFTLSVSPDTEPPAPTGSPNVVFILIDDFGWMDVGYNGSTFYETPVMDQLSTEWMRFDNCYTPSPMCSPTRVSILTGKNPARHGVTQWLAGRDTAYTRPDESPNVYCPGPMSAGIQESEVTLGEAFQEAGYETAFYGKWHMGKLAATGGPINHGYHTQQAVIEENSCSMFHPFRNHPEYFPHSTPGDNFTDLLTEAAIDFVTADRATPFYLHLSHFAMHAPIESKRGLLTHFQAKRNNTVFTGPSRKLDDYGHVQTRLRQDSPTYAGELATLDDNIGRLVQALKDSGKYHNTIIILTGDNGGRASTLRSHPTSNVPLRAGKEFLFEGGLRTPLLIYWPGHTVDGMSSDVPVSSMDFYPTLLEMAGLPSKPTQHLDGVTLVPLFNGEALARDTFYWHFPHYQGGGAYPASAIRKGDFKLIYNYHHGDHLLYDLANDPYEENNIADAMPEKVANMLPELIAYIKEQNAFIPTWLISHPAPSALSFRYSASNTNQSSLFWESILDLTYTVESTTDLSDPNSWEPASSPINGVPPFTSFTFEPMPNEPYRFFRVKQEQ